MSTPRVHSEVPDPCHRSPPSRVSVFSLPPAEEVHFKYGDIKGKPLYEKPPEQDAEEEPKKEKEAA